MRKIGVLIITCLLVVQVSTASAVLPPLYTGRDEFKTLVNDKQFTSKLDSGDVIVAIYRTKTGFTVLTNKHKMLVDVVADKSTKAGPAQFHLVFHDAVARKHVGKDVTNPSATTKTKASKASKASSSDEQ